MAKWVLLTARKLKPGTYADWREAWQPEEMPPGVHAYICRNVTDPDDIVAFGMVEATAEEVQAMRGQADEDGGRVARMAQFVDSVSTEGFYEVIDEVSG